MVTQTRTGNLTVFRYLRYHWVKQAI